MDPEQPIPWLGACTPERMRERATFARKTAASIGTPFAQLQAWLASKAALYCDAPADLVLP